MRWAFWRKRSPEPARPLPADVGLPTTHRPPAAPRDPDREDDDGTAPRTSGATPSATPPRPTTDPPLAAPAPDVDRSALAAAGPELTRVVGAALAGAPVDATDDRTLAIAATGALAARLPALSGVDEAAASDEPEDELLHAYADLLVTRAQSRAATQAGRDDLLAVAHLAAAAAAVDAAADPGLLLLAGVAADQQLRAAGVLLAQTAQDGGGAPDRLAEEVQELFAAQG